MRNEEWAKQTKVNYKHKVKIKHRAKREIKRTLKPGARGLVGSRGKAPSGVGAPPSIGDSRLGADLMKNSIKKSDFR